MAQQLLKVSPRLRSPYGTHRRSRNERMLAYIAFRMFSSIDCFVLSPPVANPNTSPYPQLAKLNHPLHTPLLTTREYHDLTFADVS